MSFQLSAGGAVVYAPVEVPRALVMSVDPAWRKCLQRLSHPTAASGASPFLCVASAAELRAAAVTDSDVRAALRDFADDASAGAYYVLGTVVKGGIAAASVVFPAAARLRLRLGLDAGVSEALQAAAQEAAQEAAACLSAPPFNMHVLLGCSEELAAAATAAQQQQQQQQQQETSPQDDVETFAAVVSAAAVAVSPLSLRASSKTSAEEMDRFVADYTAHLAQRQQQQRRKRRQGQGGAVPGGDGDGGEDAWPHSAAYTRVLRHLHEHVAPRHLALHKAYVALCLGAHEERVRSLREMVDNGHEAAGLGALLKLGVDVAPLMFRPVGGGIPPNADDDNDEDEDSDEGGAAAATRPSFLCESEEQARKLCDAYNANAANNNKTWAVATPPRAAEGAAAASAEKKDEASLWSVVRWRCPLNFSRVAPGLFASGMIQARHAPFLSALGVATIVSLVEEPNKAFASPAAKSPLRYVHIPIVDREAPDAAQTERILAALDPQARGIGVGGGGATAAVVHCLGGRGRTAYAILTYLMRFERMPLSDAFAAIRGRNTTLSVPQRRALSEFEATCEFGGGEKEEEAAQTAGEAEADPESRHHHRDPAAPPPPPPLNSNPSAVKKTQGRRDPAAVLGCDAVVMVGLPGSGKSTLAKHLAEHFGERLVRVSQDEMGRREAEAALADAPCGRGGCVVLVDRCNSTRAERAEWRPARAQRVLCVWMDTEPAVAAYRARHRATHETIRPGGPAAERIVAAMAEKFEPPADAAAEGFCAVVRLATEAEVALQVEREWGLPPLQPPPLDAPAIVKFPRTRHLVNLGAAARDDLVLSDTASFLNRPIYVEEKIDGANFGISVDPATFALVTQNRSHVVSAGYHAQFSKLTPWLSAHSAALYALLEPGREVLFGEWLVAQHSIPYSRLPGYFVAFDLYDKVTATFASRAELERRLEGSGIPLVPLIACGTYRSVDELAALATRTRSAFYDGLVEGVYLRVCEGDRTVDRAKIVRPDFIAGNEHWTRKKMIVNGLAPQE